MMAPDRGLDIEMAEPKLELERRWLIDRAARPDVSGLESTLVEDRYVDDTRLRLRRMTCRERTALKLTKKYETTRPEVRPVVTAYLTEAEYAVFAAIPAVAVTKRRYRLPIDGQSWSLDLFEGALAGLELVEAEAADEAVLHALVPPAWATREITHDPRYQCGSLAQTSLIPE
jgi:CYTH domain-containing protein